MSNTKTQTTNNIKTDTATLAGGCFWCVEGQLKQLDGVIQVISGYTGGQVAKPTYKQVCAGTTGHAEACNVIYDPEQISYDELLQAFFVAHDPTQLNRQGNDIGTQYRSAIFVHTPEQRREALEMIANLASIVAPPAVIVTEVVDSTEFFPAESYHQGYFAANPAQGYCTVVITPKVAAFRRKFAGLLTDPE